jgi:DNA-binding transcriptional regulator YhcF (GntR family)
MHTGQASAHFFVDADSPVPPYAQLKIQIRLARTYVELEPGDVLPSIRTLARQVGVGDGVVRRAYRELCQTGVLRTDQRKHVVVTPSLPPTSEASTLVQASADQCDRLIAWAGEARLSTIALGRLLWARAFAREVASPSYVFVDICRLAAEESARHIGRTWGIKVAGLSLSDFACLSRTDVHRLSAVVVNEHLYQDVRTVVGEEAPGVFPVRMRLDKRLQRRINRLPARARALIVTSDGSSLAGDLALLHSCRRLFGRARHLQAKALSEIPDMATLLKSRRYALVLFSPLAWEQTPARITRMPSVSRLATEPDPPALEHVRIAAHVLF